MADPQPRPNRALLIKIIAGVVVIGAIALLVARGLNLKELVQQGLDVIRGAGPVAFFTAMALLPACGVPMLAFSLPAVSAFGERLGTGTVVAISLVAVTINIVLTYALARRGLRPLLEKLVTKLGYKLPEVSSGDANDLVILLRVTPGIPFFVQNYLLGLGNVPFGRYVILSCVLCWPLNVAFLLFGDALLHGKGKLALLSICALAALSVATHLVRKHYSRKSAT